MKKLDENSEAHRPFKILYSSLYANVTPSFVVDITAHFDRRMAALMCYDSQYGETPETVFHLLDGGSHPDLHPVEREEEKKDISVENIER